MNTHRSRTDQVSPKSHSRSVQVVYVLFDNSDDATDGESLKSSFLSDDGVESGKDGGLEGLN